MTSPQNHRTRSARPLAVAALALTTVAAGVALADQPTTRTAPAPAPTIATAAAAMPAFDPDNGGLTLPDGFRAYVVHPGIGATRYITVREDGTLYAAMRRTTNGGGVAVVRDTTGDGRADSVEHVAPEVFGTGIALRGDWLYFGTDDSIVRYRLPKDRILPVGPPEVVVSGLLNRGQHAAKPITFDGKGNIYVTVGAPSNACQEQARTPGSPGMDPCPQLENSGGIWRFDADVLGQTQADGERYATGLRHCVAISWNDAQNDLYVVQHGRDQLNTLYPDTYTAEMNAELPAEEVHRVTEGFVGGWPYTYWNHLTGEYIIAPEYGGDGKRADESGRFTEPIQGFPGHWAPNGMTFYDGDQFPASYKGGLLIAWHGSWNRAPLRQAGYKVTFSPMGADGLPSGEPFTFADGFAGSDNIRSPRNAKWRPMGVAVGPDGSVYISDSTKGTIWRVMYVGDAGDDA
jgi:glucose/arabinose dehydrogenase